MAGVPYEVSTPVYEGPFDLLLHLILREQVDLYEVPLARIVDAYLAELDRITRDAGTVDLDMATEFLLIAATLVELKSSRLLPGGDDVDLDEELALWEERDLLLARLLACKTFKDAAVALGRLADAAARSLPRTAGLDERFAGLAPDLLDGVSPDDLRSAFVRACTPKPVPRIDLDHVAPVRVSVTDAIEELVDELPRVGRIGFRALTASLVARLDVVVRFLALLELYRQGAVELDQAATFADIQITWLGAAGDADGDRDGLGTGALVDLTTVDAYDG